MDANGNVTTLAYPGSGNNVTHTFDQLDRLTAVSGFNASVAFAYDSASRRTSQVNGNGTGQGYNYDKVDNLVGMTIGGLKPNTTLGTPSRIDFGYLRNDAGQSQSKTVSDSNFAWQPSLASTITYGTANNLNQYPSVESDTYTYDDNGCLVNDGTNTFAYDLESRLVSVTTPSTSVAYKYDPFGRLALKTTSTSATRYLYSGMQRIEEYNNTTGALLRRYVYGVSLDECLYTIDVGTSALTYLHGDETGSTILTTDSTGMPTQRNVYTPYGHLSSGSLSDIRIGYTGQFFETETGLYFYKARHYSPKLGRFLQPDPIGYKGGLNLYEYVGSDPINITDPMGLKGIFRTIGSALFGRSGSIGGLIVDMIVDYAAAKIASRMFDSPGSGGSGSFSQRVSDLYRQFTPNQQPTNQSPAQAAHAQQAPSYTGFVSEEACRLIDLIARDALIRQNSFREVPAWDFYKIARKSLSPRVFNPKEQFNTTHLRQSAQRVGNQLWGKGMREKGFSLPFSKAAAGVAQIGTMIGSHIVKNIGLTPVLLALVQFTIQNLTYGHGSMIHKTLLMLRLDSIVDSALVPVSFIVW